MISFPLLRVHRIDVEMRLAVPDATRRTMDEARLSSNALSICHHNHIYSQAKLLDRNVIACGTTLGWDNEREFRLCSAERAKPNR
jgi:hypothetical protein